MKVFIWSPLISEVGTTWTVINTVKAINRYSRDKLFCYLIDVANEWEDYKEEIRENNINLIKLGNKIDFKKLPKFGFIKSRITYLIIFFSSIFKLHKLLKKEKPEYLFVHLITPVPLFLLLFFNYNTKFILRISGFPKLNFFRKYFWKLLNKKIYRVFSPSTYTKDILIKKKIFSQNIINVVNEPILDIQNIKKKQKTSTNKYLTADKEYVLSIGRLTKQKNFKFLINGFDKILKQDPKINLLICGDGEEKKNLEKEIKRLDRNDNIHLIGYQKNIYPILHNAKFFVLTSEWEDPGFVLIESMFSNTIILSSDCESGPLELIKNFVNGYLYKKDDMEDFVKLFLKIYSLTKYENPEIKKIKFNAKKSIKKFTLFNYYKNLEKCLLND